MSDDVTGDWMDDPGSGGTPGSLVKFDKDELIGFALVFSASLGICVSLNIQKHVHVRNTNVITGQPDVNFLKLPLWWAGVLLNAVSELVRRGTGKVAAALA